MRLCKEPVIVISMQDFMSCLEKDLGNKAQPQIWDMANCLSIKNIKGKNTSKGKTPNELQKHFLNK